jgi:hypothetical protein
MKLSGLSRTVPNKESSSSIPAGDGYTTRKNVGDLVLFLKCSEYDRALESAPRYVEFNVDEIQHVACAAVGAQRCVMFKKIGEGMYFTFCVLCIYFI